METLSSQTFARDQTVLAVDLGGTKTAVALINGRGEILCSRQEYTLQSGPEKGIAQIIHLLEQVLQESHLAKHNVAGIGIGIPAVLEAESDLVIWAPNLRGWRNIPLRSELEHHFKLPTRIEYDGHTAVLGEWWQGSGKGHQSVINIIIGTGVGGGMIMEGRLIRGYTRLAGAVGWFVVGNPLIPQEEVERSLGSWEARVAGPGLARYAQSLLEQERASDSILRNVEKEITAKDIFTAAHQGDSLALQILGQWAELVGMGIANVVSLINPEVIILGGGVGSNASNWIPIMETAVRKYAQPISAQQVKIVVSVLGHRAGLLGAAFALFQRLEQEKNSLMS